MNIITLMTIATCRCISSIFSRVTDLSGSILGLVSTYMDVVIKWVWLSLYIGTPQCRHLSIMDIINLCPNCGNYIETTPELRTHDSYMGRG